MDLLNLTSTHFQYNGKYYKQLHGTAMGSPVSVVVAEIVMQHMEEIIPGEDFFYVKPPSPPAWIYIAFDTPSENISRNPSIRVCGLFFWNNPIHRIFQIQQ